MEGPISSLLGAAACGIALYDEYFADAWILFRAVRQFTGKAADFQGIFPARQFAGTAGSLTATRCRNGLVDDGFGFGRVLFKEFFQSVGNDVVDNAFYFPVSKLGFRLTFKLRFPDFDADDGRLSFADVFTGQVVFIVL